MPAAAAIVGSLIVAGASAVEANQATQHAKGAAEAQQTAADAAIAQQTKADATTQTNKSNSASVTQQAAIQSLRASLSANSSSGGSILTSGSGTTTPTPTVTKSLLGA